MKHKYKMFFYDFILVFHIPLILIAPHIHYVMLLAL